MSTFTTYLETATQRVTPVQEADLLLELVLTQADPAVLSGLAAALNQELRALPLTLPKSVFSTLMRLIAHLDERREEIELAADPARRAGIERVAEHFAHKAQSGFSPLPLPE